MSMTARRRKQIATEVYLWLGIASSKRGDSSGAFKEFQNMFAVDTATASEMSRNISAPGADSLIDQAEKQSRGLVVDYSLEITSEPKGASVRIDGKDSGLTPGVYRSPVSKLRLEISREGYRTYTEDIVPRSAQLPGRKSSSRPSAGRCCSARYRRERR